MRFIYPFTNSRREGVKNKQFIEILEIIFVMYDPNKWIDTTFFNKSDIIKPTL